VEGIGVGDVFLNEMLVEGLGWDVETAAGNDPPAVDS
jgi:hypothetical protein